MYLAPVDIQTVSILLICLANIKAKLESIQQEVKCSLLKHLFHEDLFGNQEPFKVENSVLIHLIVLVQICFQRIF